MFKSFVFGLLSFLVILNGVGSTDINFLEIYESENTKFSTANLNISNLNLINHTHYRSDEYVFQDCFDRCEPNIKCVGVYTFKTNNNMSCCLELSDLGYGSVTNETGKSFVKIHKDNFEDGKYNIKVYVLQSNDTYYNENRTVYLDLNHNGELDENEPYITENGYSYYSNKGHNFIRHYKNSNENLFIFKNLKKGQYLIRQKLSDRCIQYYPSVNASATR